MERYVAHDGTAGAGDCEGRVTTPLRRGGNLGDHYAETLDRRTKGIETRLAMAFSRVALVSCLSRVEP